MYVVGKRVCEDVVDLATSSIGGVVLRLRPVIPAFSHFVKILPVLLHFLLLFLFLIPSNFLWNLRIHLELFLLALLAIPRYIFLLPPFLNLQKQLILVIVLPFRLTLACFHLELLVPLPLVVDIVLDERVLHCVSLGERTDVSLHVLCLVAH